MIRDNPVLGVGPNNYLEAMKQYGAIQGYWGSWAYLVHNKIALVWAETGTAGVVAFGLFLVTTIKTGWRAWKMGHPRLSPVALGLTCGLIGHLVHMQFEVFNGRAMVQLLWGSAAIIAAVSATILESGYEGPGEASPA
jgi:O-antigen ligase